MSKFRIALLLTLLGAIGAFIYLVVIPSQKAWACARILSDAMANARSVSLVEFWRDERDQTELIFKRAAATQSQIEAIRNATGSLISPIPDSETKCFWPHHRIEIIRPDGSELRFEVCFMCQNFLMKGGQISEFASLPVNWSKNLAKVFTDAGMPPQDDYVERAKKHPDYRAPE